MDDQVRFWPEHFNVPRDVECLSKVLNISGNSLMNTPLSIAKSNTPKDGRKSFNLILEIGLLMLLSLIWGSSFTWIKIAIKTIPPLTLTSIRITIAALLLILIARILGFSLPRGRKVWANFFVQGLLQSAMPFTLISWGEKQITSGLAGVLNATPPMFVLLIAIISTHKGQPVTGQKIFGVGLGLAGVFVTIGFQSVQDINTAEPIAQAAILAASLCYALASIWGQRFSSFPSIVSAASAMSCAAFVMLPAALIIEKPWTLAPTSEAIAALVILAIVCTAIAMVIYFRLVRTLGPLTTTSGSYLRAGCAVALGIIFLDESFDWSTLSGMALIVIGVVAVTLPAYPFRSEA